MKRFCLLFLVLLLLLTACTNPTELPASGGGASSEVETTDAPTESATESGNASDPARTPRWYFEWEEPRGDDEAYPTYEKYPTTHRLAIQLPQAYTVSENGLTVTLDFFRETYRSGDFLCVRITLYNETENEITFSYSEDTYKELVPSLRIVDAGSNITGYFPTPDLLPPQEREQLFEMGHVTFDSLGTGDSLILERTLYVSGYLLDVNLGTEYTLKFSPDYLVTLQDGTTETKSIAVSIPVEVVKVEVVEE